MKIEFKHKQIEQLPLNNLKPAEFLFIAVETSHQLRWVIGDINETGFVAYTNKGLFSWNAEVKIKIINGSATLQSQSMGNGYKDETGNKNNIESFICIFKDLKKHYYPIQQHKVTDLIMHTIDK